MWSRCSILLSKSGRWRASRARRLLNWCPLHRQVIHWQATSWTGACRSRDSPVEDLHSRIFTVDFSGFFLFNPTEFLSPGGILFSAPIRSVRNPNIGLSRCLPNSSTFSSLGGQSSDSKSIPKSSSTMSQSERFLVVWLRGRTRLICRISRPVHQRVEETVSSAAIHHDGRFANMPANGRQSFYAARLFV